MTSKSWYWTKRIACLIYGFIRDIRYLLRKCPSPQERLTMLFSATLSYKVRELAFEDMNSPEYIEIEPEQKNRASN